MRRLATIQIGIAGSCRFLRVTALLLLWLSTGRTVSAQPSPVDTTNLGSGVNARMHMLLEKTIFQVDVLTLDVRLGPSETARLDSMLAGREFSADLADSVAAVALGSRNVWALIDFQRGVSLDQFLGGVQDNLRHAEKAGIVTPEEYASIAASLPRWYFFLEDRRIRAGDQMFYRIRGDTLRTVFRSADGDNLLDQVDVGPERRLSVLGGYFAPNSDFRERLVKSLFRGAN